jgi:hypothetical protein
MEKDEINKNEEEEGYKVKVLKVNLMSIAD